MTDFSEQLRQMHEARRPGAMQELVPSMETKFFEVRDKGTFVPCMAFKVQPRDAMHQYLLRRAGWSPTGSGGVYFLDLLGRHPARYDPYEWGDRTFSVAHQFVNLHWSDIANGDVIDVEFILGETDALKVSERHEGVE